MKNGINCLVIFSLLGDGLIKETFNYKMIPMGSGPNGIWISASNMRCNIIAKNNLNIVQYKYC